MSERRDREMERVVVCMAHMPHLLPLSSAMMTLRIHGTNGLFFFVDHGINNKYTFLSLNCCLSLICCARYLMLSFNLVVA
jgi:hypothetical protein